MGFFPELKRLPLEDVMSGFAGPDLPPDVPEEERPLWLDEAAVRIAESGSAGLAFLIHSIPQADEPRLRAILLALSFVDKRVLKKRAARLRDLLLAFLDDPRPLVVARAVDALSDLGHGDVIDRVLPLRDHSSPYVVGSVLRFLSRHHPDQARPILLQALDSDQPIVRQNAVDELDELHCVEALPRLRRLLEDPDEHVRQAAQTAVVNLEGERAVDEPERRHE